MRRLLTALLLTMLAAGPLAGQEIPEPDLSGVDPPVRERLTALRNRLSTHLADAEAWGRYAMALDAHELGHEARFAYEEAHRLDPGDFRWAYYLATLLDTVDPAAALPWFERAVAIDPGYGPARVRYGETLERNARLEEAAVQYREAVRLDPTNPFGPFGLGRLALGAGEVEGAIAELERAYDLDPKIRALVATLAQAYFRAGRRELAEERAAEARRLPRKTYRPDERRAAVKEEAVDVRSHLARSKTYRDTGQLNAALAEALKAIEVAPDFASAHFAAAEIFMLQGNSAAAINLAEKARQLDADLPAVDPFLAQAYFEQQRFASADEAARRALARSPDDPHMHLLLSMTAAQQGDVARVVEHLGRAYNLRPQDRESLKLLESLLADLAASFAGAGMFSEAAEAQSKVVELAKARGAAASERERLEQRLERYRSGRRG